MPDPRLTRLQKDIIKTFGARSIAKEQRPRINEEIRAPMIRLIDENGSQMGLFQPRDALRIARERELDLIEIAPNAKPPVCRILEFGKFRFEHQKKERAARKHQHARQMKEIQIRPNIDEHDADFKLRHAREFLLEGSKVKVVLVFKGREMAYVENGKRVLNEFIEKLAGAGKLENVPKLEGKQMIAIIAPAAAAKKQSAGGVEQ